MSPLQANSLTRRILVMSSYVARGTVGLQATLPALIQDTFEIIAIPTIVLSNHPAHKASAGTPLDPHVLLKMIDSLDTNGWLHGVSAIMTGYLPTAEHATWASQTVSRVKALNPKAIYVADPVLGDDPEGLYVGRDVAEAIRDLLIPLADVATPNRFELSWLTGQTVEDETSAIAAARKLAVPVVAATSIPRGNHELANVIITASKVATAVTRKIRDAPHGTGDCFSGLLLCELLNNQPHSAAIETATAAVENILAHSRGMDYLKFSSPARMASGLPDRS